jgi:hypothetical protein
MRPNETSAAQSKALSFDFVVTCNLKTLIKSVLIKINFGNHELKKKGKFVFKFTDSIHIDTTPEPPKSLNAKFHMGLIIE